MKIAVTYENGHIFQHFGKTPSFKVYEVQDGEIKSTEILKDENSGHEALVMVLKEKNIDLLICGGMGPGAQNALSDAKISVISGISGDADQAVTDFLSGKLKNADMDSSSHEEKQVTGENCTADCRTCAGCSEPHIVIQGKNAGKKVKVHYTGTLNDGSQFDSSYDRGEPLEFISGIGMMIPGFDQAVVNMDTGTKVKIHLLPEEAYGPIYQEAIFTVKLAQMPGAEDLNVDDRVYLRSYDGRQIPVRVAGKTKEDITFDANHELAGKELNFEIELLSVEDGSTQL